MRFAVLLAVAACSRDASPPPASPPPEPERVAVPGTAKSDVARRADPPMSPDEGTIEVSAAAGAAKVRILPGAGFHINTRYPIAIDVTAKGATLAKARLSAKDAERLEETELAIPIAFSSQPAGAYEVTGTVRFGICKHDACLAREMPVRLAAR